jgi:5-methylcytosine-specific restriction endonuclease McrA
MHAKFDLDRLQVTYTGMSTNQYQARPTMSADMRNHILGRQFNKCNNNPNGPSLRNLGTYKCPMWARVEHPGSFDESGHHIDHIEPWAQTYDNSASQLQALCVACHAVKTRTDNLETLRVKRAAARAELAIKAPSHSAAGATSRSAAGATSRSAANATSRSTAAVTSRLAVAAAAAALLAAVPALVPSAVLVPAALFAPPTARAPTLLVPVITPLVPAEVAGGFACPKCNAVFADNAHLKRHLARKTPCDPILKVAPRSGKLSCRYCNRPFTTSQALSRHTKHRCKIANGSEGERPADLHLLAEQTAKVDELQARVAELTALLKGQLSLGGQKAAPPAADALTVAENIEQSPQRVLQQDSIVADEHP